MFISLQLAPFTALQRKYLSGACVTPARPLLPQPMLNCQSVYHGIGDVIIGSSYECRFSKWMQHVEDDPNRRRMMEYELVRKCMPRDIDHVRCFPAYALCTLAGWSGGAFENISQCTSGAERTRGKVLVLERKQQTVCTRWSSTA